MLEYLEQLEAEKMAEARIITDTDLVERVGAVIDLLSNIRAGVEAGDSTVTADIGIYLPGAICDLKDVLELSELAAFIRGE